MIKFLLLESINNLIVAVGPAQGLPTKVDSLRNFRLICAACPAA
ncbi:hypothetical protein [Arthrobacter alkaliphilus]|jgi:hypothetical protein|nr:hypothetical protein [Arthrobacter alkaliphilus]